MTIDRPGDVMPMTYHLDKRPVVHLSHSGKEQGGGATPSEYHWRAERVWPVVVVGDGSCPHLRQCPLVYAYWPIRPL